MNTQDILLEFSLSAAQNLKGEYRLVQNLKLICTTVYYMYHFISLYIQVDT